MNNYRTRYCDYLTMSSLTNTKPLSYTEWLEQLLSIYEKEIEMYTNEMIFTTTK